MNLQYLRVREDYEVELAAVGNLIQARHRFEAPQLAAINAALATCRPLLVRGEPGIGKSQLARAAAKALGRAFVQHVVDSRTESRDLLWHFDAVGRLAAAQISGALTTGPSRAHGCASRLLRSSTDRAAKAARDALAIEQFIHPRALWWGFDWKDALDQAMRIGADAPLHNKDGRWEGLDGGDPERGWVVLIDEIDKGEPDVPNGLLEALGAGSFTPQGRLLPVKHADKPPLVVITTNEERALPDAFVRRCMVLHLGLPEDEKALIERLIERGRVHFRDCAEDDVLRKAAELLAVDRKRAKERRWTPLPGQAEYLDLVRAVVNQCPRKPAGEAAECQLQLIGEVAEFVLKKPAEAAAASAPDESPIVERDEVLDEASQ